MCQDKHIAVVLTKLIQVTCGTSETSQPENEMLPLAQRRPRRLNRRLPLRFRDQLPENPFPLPPPGIEPPEVLIQEASGSHISRLSPPVLAQCSVFKTQRNKFGLFRVFRSEALPSHDPDEQPASTQSFLPRLTSTNYADPTPPVISTSDNPFHPYPNYTSLQLGDWYWNHGPQKSQEDFKLLLEVVGNLEFRPEDVRNTNWRAIDRELGSNLGDGLEADDGWSRSPITISVPFHSRMPNPGSYDYTIPDFHHRRLVSIIREALSDPSYHRIYHYESYELRWHPPNKACDDRVYGELYTSEAFIKAQERLMASPREPDCDLTRCIAAVMFWSDATQLTSFGSAKLWPLYLYFGNQSKYMRCQPSSNLCSHVAYFKQVDQFLCVLILIADCHENSFQMHSRIS